MHSEAVLIRPATLRDRDFVLDTARRLACFEPPPHRTCEQIVAADARKLASYFSRRRRLKRSAARALRHRPHASLLVAEAAGRALGFLYIDEARDYFSGRNESYIDIVAVSEEAQGRRIGKALLQAAEGWALERGHSTISLNVFAANRQARGVYEHLGYVVESARYVKELRPAQDEPRDGPREAARAARDDLAPRSPRDDEAFWSELHEIVFTPAHFARAAPEAERLLALAPGPADRVLDLGCGPGGLSIELARRGRRVTGVEGTELLLRRASERAYGSGVHVEWVHRDPRGFVRPRGFDLVLRMEPCLSGSARAGDDLQLLHNALESLAPGGALVLEAIGKECLARSLQPESSEPLPGGAELVRRREIRDDWSRLQEEWLVRRGAGERTFRREHALYSGQELRELMQRAGFVEVRLFGGTDAAPYGPDAVSLLAVGRRSESAAA